MKLWGMNAGYEIYINNYEARLNSYLKTGMNCSKIIFSQIKFVAEAGQEFYLNDLKLD